MRLIFVSKSRWTPAVRREHALAREAAAHGLAVDFVQRPVDVRALAGADGRRQWRAALARRATPTPDGVTVHEHAVLVPGHRSDLSERAAARLLARRLRRLARPGDTVVVCTPWQWPALAALPDSVRRVFDGADDWGALVPARRAAFERRYAEIAAQADAVVLASPDLAPRFARATVTVVANGVEAALIAAPRAAEARPRSMVYVGTLSERFDAPLVAEMLRALPGWRLDLYGQCQYAGLGERPAPELLHLLEAFERVTWHGPVPRDRVAAVLDRAQVAILPNRPELTTGQDAMKLYDYAARGLPIVSTPWSQRLVSDGPPGLVVAGDAAGLAEAVAGASSLADERRAWAAQRTWERRWAAWAAAALGVPGGSGTAALRE
jgi:glycosyltransferase involved in cell wall biosynthesis